MQISDILLEKGTSVVTIDADQSIHDAISTLNKHRIGALIVTTAGKDVVGIITERDILRRCGDLCNKSEPTGTSATTCSSLVNEAMTKDLVIAVPDDDPNFVMGMMTKNRIRHLPILDEGNLVGIISIGDLVNAHLEERVIESRTLKDYIARNDTPSRVKTI